jgi:hypothetical protein
MTDFPDTSPTPKVERRSFDPYAYGRLTERVLVLLADVEKLAHAIQELNERHESSIRELTTSIGSLNSRLSQLTNQMAGGWRVITIVGTVGAAVGGIITHLVSAWTGRN